MTDLQRYGALLNASDPEETMAFQLKAAGLPEPIRQFRFLPPRRWRADFAWPERMLLLEVDGGVFIAGGHNRGQAYTLDRERDAEAICNGWTVLRVTSGQVESGQALSWVERLLKGVK
jgi:very-short-patch-repair endonuclease